jgi:hypothetical protein
MAMIIEINITIFFIYPPTNISNVRLIRILLLGCVLSVTENIYHPNRIKHASSFSERIVEKKVKADFLCKLSKNNRNTTIEFSLQSAAANKNKYLMYDIFIYPFADTVPSDTSARISIEYLAAGLLPITRQRNTSCMLAGGNLLFPVIGSKPAAPKIN